MKRTEKDWSSKAYEIFRLRYKYDGGDDERIFGVVFGVIIC